MSEHAVTLELLPNDAEYRRRFGTAVRALIDSGKDHCRDLLPVDIVGAYLSAAVTLAASNGIGVAEVLRSIADDLDTREPPRVH